MLTLGQAFPSRVSAAIAAADSDLAFKATLAAIDGGIPTVEVSAAVPACLDIVRGLVASMFGSVRVGLGTVWDPALVGQARRAGACFIVTPTFIPAIASACAQHDLLGILGAMTPTEIRQAWRAGASAVSIFPVQPLGGVEYVRCLQPALADVPLCVAGGIPLEALEAYLSAPIAAVTLDSAVFPPDALQRADIAAVTRLARRAMAAAGALRV